MIVQNVAMEGDSLLSFTVPRESADRAVEAVQKAGIPDVSVEPALAKLSVVGVGMRTHTGVATRMFAALAERGININLINTSEVRINVGTDVSRGREGLECLRKAFALATEEAKENTDATRSSRPSQIAWLELNPPGIYTESEQSVADQKREKVVLAYSGGLDTSVAVKWINETYNMDVIAYTCDLGQGQDIEAIRQKALRTGAVDAVAEDARNLFIDWFVFPSLAAGALYEGKYPLATALGRPLIAQLMVRVARDHGATAVAHGCTGKGNDQVRFDVTFQTLAPELKIIAPVREWKWTRTQELEYAAKHGIEVEATKKSIFSTDQNLWGRSIEAGILEDPWVEPPPETFQWTTDPKLAPDEPEEVEITFDRGKPVALGGRELDAVELIGELNQLAGKHGIGRIDHIENRLVGIKSREIYEAPGGRLAPRSSSRARIPHPLQGIAPVQNPGEPGLRRPDLQRPLVQPASPGPDGLHDLESAIRLGRPSASSFTRAMRRWSAARACTAFIATSWRPMKKATSTTHRRRSASSRSTGWARPPRPSTSSSAAPAAAGSSSPASSRRAQTSP